MVNYSTGKIYKLHSITHPELGVYIGSTIETLSRRIAGHRSNFKRYQAGKRDFTTSFTILEEADDVVITLIEAVSCESKDQLLARERYWIETLECVNKNIPGRTDAESAAAYRVANRERILVSQAEYRVVNRHELNARAVEKIVCECGCEVTRSNLPRHRKTNKHIQLMSAIHEHRFREEIRQIEMHRHQAFRELDLDVLRLALGETSNDESSA